MEEESFTDPDTAAYMNQNFVCIKVDREERPDIDSIYMSAVQSISGQGGWPLTVFLTPDKLPFFGGTYFPPTAKNGLPGFPELLKAIDDAFRNRRTEINTSSENIRNHINKDTTLTNPTAFSDRETATAYKKLLSQYDDKNGGFRDGIKFPQPMNLEFLLHYHSNHPSSQALNIVEKTISAILSGGIYDHIGGGIHRYATEPTWTIPHFEKMLYDNALFTKLLIHTYQLTQNKKYKLAAYDILRFIKEEMIGDDNLFHSAQDADTEGIEGKFYTWDEKTLRILLDEHEFTTFTDVFKVSTQGNYQGLNILRYDSDYNIPGFITENQELQSIRHKLKTNRSHRTRPFQDEKSIMSWNALMSQSFIEAYLLDQDEALLEIAILNTKSLLNKIDDCGFVFRSWKQGSCSGYGFLEDYAALINLLLILHEATLELDWLHKAIDVTNVALSLFYDSKNVLFYDTPDTGEHLIIRPRNNYDNAYPSGVSEICLALYKLGTITNNKEYIDISISQCSQVINTAIEYPASFGNWLNLIEMISNSTREICILSKNKTSASDMQFVLYNHFFPNKVVVGISDFKIATSDTISPLLTHRTLVNDECSVFVCKNYICQLPTTSPDEFLKLLTIA
jgi:uncharacterized protein YyaL (SSP411 family)